MKLYRVVVTDDERSFAEGIADSLELESDIEVIGLAPNGREAVEMATRCLPDVVLMDLDMPIMGGVEAIQAIKHAAPGVEVSVLTVFSDNAHLFEALQAGAKGYLLKNAEPEEVAKAVRDVAQGIAAIPPVLAARVLAEFQRIANQTPQLCQLFSLLTHQETEVLKLIGQNKSNQQIGEELFLEMPTVKKHVGNILKKLEVNGRTEAALIAQNSGLLQQPGFTGSRTITQRGLRT